MIPVVSLFSGIGGLELGLEWAGFGPVVVQVESDAFSRAVLYRHWPNADRSITDVRQYKGHPREDPWILCGGFPCQDISQASRRGRAGLEGKKSGLWHEFKRIIDEAHPTFVVIENMYHGSHLWLDAVCDSLNEARYRTRALGISARDVGAPHLRQRVFVIAQLADPDSRGCIERWKQETRRSLADGRYGARLGDRDHLEAHAAAGDDVAQPEMGRPPHGIPAGLVRQRPVLMWPAGRGEEQHPWEPPRVIRPARGRAHRNRAEELRCLGNAVVPACAAVAGTALIDWAQLRS